MKSKNIFLISLSACFAVLFTINVANAAYVQQHGWWDTGNPYVASVDYVNGSGVPVTFSYSVNFDLSFDSDTNLYRYEYQVTNINDSSDAVFQTIQISIANVVDSGYFAGTGDVMPFYVGIRTDPDFGTILDARFFDIPETQTGDTIWMTSYAPPGTGQSRGEGAATPWAYGDGGGLPAPVPVPEPSAMLLLGFGLVGLLGIGKKRFGK